MTDFFGTSILSNEFVGLKILGHVILVGGWP